MSAVAYERRGAGEALVLVHPLGGDRHSWDPVLDGLAAERDVIAVDLPGFGDSDPLAEPPKPTPRALMVALGGLLDELGIERAHVAGNSLGAWVALELALAGRARSVTALCPAGLWPAPLAPRLGAARQVARLALPLVPLLVWRPGGRRLALAATVARPERVPASDAARMIRAYARAPGFDAVNAAMRAGRFEGLERIRVPVTLAWGERDRLVAPPRHVPTTVRQVVLRGCGHLPMWDDPAAVTRLLLSMSATS